MIDIKYQSGCYQSPYDEIELEKEKELVQPQQTASPLHELLQTTYFANLFSAILYQQVQVQSSTKKPASCLVMNWPHSLDIDFANNLVLSWENRKPDKPLTSFLHISFNAHGAVNIKFFEQDREWTYATLANNPPPQELIKIMIENFSSKVSASDKTFE